MRIRIVFYIILCLILCLGNILAQTVWTVPIDQPNIQTAITLSTPGGTININGAYNPILALETFPVWINVPNLTIQGQIGGEIIPGDNTNKIFIIIGGASGCTIQNLVFIQAGGGDPSLMTPSGDAGAIFINDPVVSILGCDFYDGNATNGAGIFIGGTFNVDVIGCFFGGNVAGTDGGGIKVINSHDISITSCVFDTNIAGNVGGGISVENSANTLTYPYDVQISSCEFYDNTSLLDGGAISWWESDGVIDYNTIGDNTDPSKANTSKYGGGISVVNCTAPSFTLIETNDIYYNTANGILPCSIIGNGGWGGGIFIENSDDTVMVRTNNNVTSNTATFYGGGIAVNAYLAPCYPIIQENTLKYNQVTTQCDPAEPNGGGGICVRYDLGYSNHPLIDSNNILGNQVLGGMSYGGGIACIYSAPHISKNNIEQNIAQDDGGGISILGGFLFQINRGNIIENNIYGNYAESLGGGLHIKMDTSGPVLMDRNKVDNNTAGPGFGIGGGLYLIDSAVTARSNNFTNNQCAISTGTAVCVDVGCNLKFYNNTVADNNMSVSDGDAMCLASPADLQNNIFSGHPNIYAIKEYFFDQAVPCTNNLFWNNGKVYRDYALGERNVTQLNAMVGNTGNLSGDPMLDSSYHLSTSFSAAYNAGVDLTGFGVTFDIDNEVRPQDGAFEIGSDECLPSTSVKDWCLF